MVQALDRVYMLTDDALMRLSREGAAKLTPLIKLCADPINLGDNDLTGFCGCVLPEIQDLVAIDDPSGALADLNADGEQPPWHKAVVKHKKVAASKEATYRVEFENVLANCNAGAQATVKDMMDYYGGEKSEKTIYRWIKKYGYQIDKNNGMIIKQKQRRILSNMDSVNENALNSIPKYLKQVIGSGLTFLLNNLNQLLRTFSFSLSITWFSVVERLLKNTIL
jgi:hypothetical protein